MTSLSKAFQNLAKFTALHINRVAHSLSPLPVKERLNWNFKLRLFASYALITKQEDEMIFGLHLSDKDEQNWTQTEHLTSILTGIGYMFVHSVTTSNPIIMFSYAVFDRQ